MKPQRIAYLFYNPGSGQGDPGQELATIYSKLEPEIPIVLVESKKDRDLTKQCHEMIEMILNRPKSASSMLEPIAVVSGGDGTVSAMANAVINTGIPFGVIPRGTANGFAVALGIPTELEAACDNLRKGTTRLVDAATCSPGLGNSMILLAGIGWEANMVQTAQGLFKQVFGQFAYIWGGVKGTLSPEPFKCKLKVNGGELTKYVKTHSITVAAVAPAGSISAQGTGKVIPDDGLLDVTIQTCEDDVLKSMDAMAHLMTAALINEPTKTDTVMHLRAKEIEIKCKSKQHVVVDGEVLPRRAKRFHYKVIPEALNVIAPPPPVERR